MKTFILLTGLFALSGFSWLAAAHDYTGSLGTSATATDAFYTPCLGADNTSITYQIRRNSGTSTVNAQSTRPVGPLISAGKTGVFYPATPVRVSTKAGAKIFKINKTADGASGYTLRMHCWDKTGNHNPDDQPSFVTYLPGGNQ